MTKILIFNPEMLDVAIEDLQQQFAESGRINLSYEKASKPRTLKQLGFIWGALIDSVVKFFRECGYVVTPESVKGDLYSETEQYLPELVVERTIFGNRKPRMKTLSEMNREEMSLFIDAVFQVLENNKIFSALELSPDIRNNWVYHVTKEEINEVSKIKLPQEDSEYLNYIRSLPCLVCGKRGYTNAHHLKDPALCGLSQKAGDWATIPLCCAGYNGGCHHGLAHGQGVEALNHALRWIPFDLKDFCALQYNRWRLHK